MAKTKKLVPRPAETTTLVSPRQKNVLALKGSGEWKAWLDDFATLKGMPVTVLVDHSLRELAKREGHPAPPPRVP